MIKQTNTVNVNSKSLIESREPLRKKRFKSENNLKKRLFSISKNLHIYICNSLVQKINLKKRLFSLKNRSLRYGVEKKW